MIKTVFKLLFNISIILFISGCTLNNQNNSIHCYNGHTSLDETVKAVVLTDVDYSKKLNLTENAKYKEETFPETEDFNNSCTNNFSKDSCTKALDFAKKLKYIYKNKDFETFANIISYPVTITEISTSGKVKSSIDINSKRELLNLDKRKIMNDKIFKAIDENGILVNWKGFMLGNGEIWWFQEDDKSSEFRLNILE